MEDDDTKDAPPRFYGRLSRRPDHLYEVMDDEQDDDLSCAVRFAMLAAYQCGLAFGPIPCTSADEARSREWALDALIDAHVRRIAALRGQGAGGRGQEEPGKSLVLSWSHHEEGMSMSVENYRDLVAWQKSMDLVEAVYRASQGWPRDELYGLTNQARRAAVSVPANIAEGHGRYGKAETLHHLSIADGSLKELETHLLIAGRLAYMRNEDTQALLASCTEVGRILGGLMRSMR